MIASKRATSSRDGKSCGNLCRFLALVLSLVFLVQILLLYRLVILHSEGNGEHNIISSKRSHPAFSYHPKFPLGTPVPRPYRVDTSKFTKRQWKVVDAIRHAWGSYRRCAMGHDQLKTDKCGSYSDWGQSAPSNVDEEGSQTAPRTAAAPVLNAQDFNGKMDFAASTSEEGEPYPNSSSQKGNQERFGLGVTLIESLDTLYLAGEDAEFQRGVAWLAKNHTWDIDANISLFETTIRLLGGLLSAYELSGELILLEKAFDLGERLLAAWQQDDRIIPFATVNLKYKNASQPEWLGNYQSLSEITTLQIEFTKLSQLTGDSRFARKANRIMPYVLHALDLAPHRLPSGYINRKMPGFDGRRTGITLGSRGDSFYEYVVKQWVLTNRTSSTLEAFYDQIRSEIHNLLVIQLDDEHAFIAENEYYGGWKQLKMDHLVCFASGMLLLGREAAHSRLYKKDSKLADDLARTCFDTYAMMPTGLGPDIVEFQRLANPPEGHGHPLMGLSEEDNRKLWFKRQYGMLEMRAQESWHYILRPEALEGLFYVKRSSLCEISDPSSSSSSCQPDRKKAQQFEDMAWDIFSAIDRNLKRDVGFTGTHNVSFNLSDTGMFPRLNDTNVMETFFLAETLKYALLVFEDSSLGGVRAAEERLFNFGTSRGEEVDDGSSGRLLPLDQWVFNTEAHPVRIFDPSNLHHEEQYEKEAVVGEEDKKKRRHIVEQELLNALNFEEFEREDGLGSDTEAPGLKDWRQFMNRGQM